MPHIRQEVLSRLKNDESLQLQIAQGLNKRMSTVIAWLRSNHKMLASKAVVLLIKEITGLSEDEIVEPEPATV
jgi:hypothetical protein